MRRKYTIRPEDNAVILFLLLIFSFGLYYFVWLARISRLFNDNPTSNIILSVLTAGVWAVYLNIRYLQKSEELNKRDFKWYFLLFIWLLPLPVLIIQNNISEYARRDLA